MQKVYDNQVPCPDCREFFTYFKPIQGSIWCNCCHKYFYLNLSSEKDTYNRWFEIESNLKLEEIEIDTGKDMIRTPKYDPYEEFKALMASEPKVSNSSKPVNKLFSFSKPKNNSPKVSNSPKVNKSFSFSKPVTKESNLNKSFKFSKPGTSDLKVSNPSKPVTNESKASNPSKPVTNESKASNPSKSVTNESNLNNLAATVLKIKVGNRFIPIYGKKLSVISKMVLDCPCGKPGIFRCGKECGMRYCSIDCIDHYGALHTISMHNI